MGNFIKQYSNRILIIIAFIFIISGLIFPFFIKHYSIHKFDGLGTIGDWYGGIANPIIGIASFIIIYAAFKLQKDNNKSQQDQINSQNTNLNLQRFETTFFQLLTFHHEITKNLKISTQLKLPKQINKPLNNTTNSSDADSAINADEAYILSSGKDFFSSSIEILKIYYQEDISSIKEKNPNLTAKTSAMKNSYVKFYEENQASLGHYFRNLYHIAKYIDNSSLVNDKEKRTYIGIYRAQLSAYELILLLYNCSCEDLGFPKFRTLVIKHSILKNMNRKLLLDDDHYAIFEQLV